MKYKVGQYTGVKMASGRYQLCKILDIYMPGETKIFCDRPYTNCNDHPTFYLDWGGISVPDIFFKSKRDADLWILKKKFESVQEELEKERAAHKRTLSRLSDIRKALAKL
jgi:hypothetical protein